MDEINVKKLRSFAVRIRMGTLEAIHSLGSGHLGGSLSIADVLAVLYGREMKVDPKNPGWPERDKLVCSKGHAGPAVYSTLANLGFIPYEELKTLNRPGTRLPSHCDRNKTPGVDMTTGSLGQGTSLAAGMALGDRLRGYSSRTFLIVGDGEHRGTGPCHAPQIGADQFGGLTLQGRGGFIDKHITFAQQTTNGQHHALALATTEFGHLLVVGLGSQMQAFHLFLQPFLRERQMTILSQLEGQSHHLTHLLIGKQRQLLGQIGHLPAEDLGRMWR